MTMFQSFLWNYTAVCAFSDRERPYVIYTDSDEGAALIPAAVDQPSSRLTLLGETLFDYRNVLSAGDEPTLYSAWNRAAQAELNFSSGAVRGDCDVRCWKSFEPSHFYGAPRVSPQEISADTFSATHNRLARWARRLEREGIELRCHNGRESELVRWIYEQKGRQAVETGNNLFADPRRVKFMSVICRTVGSACEIFTLQSAATLVAALVTFRDRQVRRFYTVYFDPAWAKYSPGMVLVYEVTRRSLNAGLECDYMTGEHGYKVRLATSVVPMFWMEASAHSLASLGAYQPALAA